MELKKEEIHMELSKQDIEKLRKDIMHHLTNIEIGDNVHIEKGLLERLLFDVVTVDKEKKVVVKLPVWSGYFLRKIDLREVDFSDVSWCILGNEKFKIGFNDLIISSDSVYSEIEKINDKKIDEVNALDSNFFVDYSCTNAKIDLTKSYEAKHGRYIEIRDCNFTDLDFSKLDLSEISELILINSSITNTELCIPSETGIKATKSYLENIDLSTRTINASDYFMKKDDGFENCYLNNSKINIKLYSYDFSTQLTQQRLKNAMANNWVGCYVNGKKVLSPEEQAAKKESLKAQYEQMKNEIFVSTLENIDKQAKQKKKVFNYRFVN